MTINLRDYARTSAQRGWGAGWPSCTGAKNDTVIVTAAKSGTRFSVRRGLSRLASALVDETERRGYLLKKGQTGAFNCRAIGGTKRPSNHSWAVAIDINWQDNPMRNPLRTDLPAWVVALWNRYGFAWGGHYSGTKDPMHFEFMGTPADALAMTALALRELRGVTTPATQPARPPAKRPLLRQGSTGDHVKALQAALRIRADGDFGPITAASVRTFQRSRGLKADGIVGPATWAALGI